MALSGSGWAAGELPIIGVNTFLGPDGSPTSKPKDVRRSTEEEKIFQIRSLEVFQKVNAERRDAALDDLKEAALAGENVFASLMEAVKSCSLGQLSGALYEVGGQYRRNM